MLQSRFCQQAPKSWMRIFLRKLIGFFRSNMSRCRVYLTDLFPLLLSQFSADSQYLSVRHRDKPWKFLDPIRKTTFHKWIHKLKSSVYLQTAKNVPNRRPALPSQGFEICTNVFSPSARTDLNYLFRTIYPNKNPRNLVVRTY